ncbi:uncharacterized protein LOC126686396 [Mercurialis annua]|uniref:uncharacterized protein LOC126686396 n=1 Tax=Mercurialis annua TaxID=3986 RepID=UPI002160B25B|nr:uncharacterized protein LOC126686396 [Mercurialis annua]
MAHKVPSFGVMASTLVGIRPQYAHNYTPQSGSSTPGVRFSQINVLDPTTKIEFERSGINPNFFHIRSCFLNKYWSFCNATTDDVILLSGQKNEDTSHFSCTLFELIFEEQQRIYFIRSVFRRRFLHFSLNGGILRLGLRTDTPPTPDPNNVDTQGCRFRLMEWDTFVKLPKYVTFRGHNNKFLKANMYSISASADESNNNDTAFEVIETGDGHVELRTSFNGEHWFNSNHHRNFISPFPSQPGPRSSTRFWPVKVSGNVIALRSASNERFCRHLSQGHSYVDCLNASGTAINSDARLTVGEPVNARRMYDVRYHMDNARIYGQRAVVAGTGRATNRGREEAMLSVDISFEDRSSYTFTNSRSLTTGISTTITAGFGKIASLEVGIEISSEQTVSTELGKEVSRTITSGTSYSVPVPPMSTVIVNYVATEGKCDIPFSYTQRDQDSINGTFRYSNNVDGVYTGVNYFHFDYDQPRFRSLQEEENVE